jgi:hypothetical protein
MLQVVKDKVQTCFDVTTMVELGLGQLNFNEVEQTTSCSFDNGQSNDNFEQDASNNEITKTKETNNDAYDYVGDHELWEEL